MYKSNYDKLYENYDKKQLVKLLEDTIAYTESNVENLLLTAPNRQFEESLLQDLKFCIEYVREEMSRRNVTVFQLKNLYRFLNYETIEAYHRYVDVADAAYKYMNKQDINKNVAYDKTGSGFGEQYSIPKPQGFNSTNTPDGVLMAATKSIELMEKCYREGHYKDIPVSNLVVATEKLKIAMETKDDVMIALEQRVVQNEMENLAKKVMSNAISKKPLY